MLEATLVATLRGDLRAKAWATFEEVPFLHRRIDLVAVDPSGSALIAIEAKVKNWRDAARQAVSCLLCCDRVYVAVPERIVRAVDLDHLRGLGVGLISVGESVVSVLEPPRSVFRITYHAESLLGTLHAMES